MTRSLLLALGLCACGSNIAPAAAVREAEVPERADAAGAEASTRGATETIALRRATHEDMTEVVLDPGGEAALTLDREGGVRLWDANRSEDAPTPWMLPLQEPTWMSLARAGEHAFVVAHVDGGHVGRVAIEGERAHYEPLFDVPPSEPLFELWVLDGGKRILALGVDHRVRLYDAAGTVRSEIDERGFVPWQLRVVQPKGKPPAIAAVLARPTRAQRIQLEDDALSVVGEAQMVALDQSPNRNDLELSPDGRTIGALRRPKHRGTTWWLELIDLDDGKRRKITGDADAKVRPRLHLLEGDRALLYAGTGKGQRVDLGKAKAVTIGETPPPPASFVDAVTEVEVPGSISESRMQTTVAAGLRAVASGSTLLADPIDDEAVFTHGVDPFRPRVGAVSPNGERIAWAGSSDLHLEENGVLTEVASADTTIAAVTFIDDAHLLVVSFAGVVTIRKGTDGTAVASTSVPLRWGIADVAWDGDGTLVITGQRGDVHALAVRDGALAKREAPASDARALLRAAGLGDVKVREHVVDDRGRHVIGTAGERPTLHVLDGEQAQRVRLRHGGIVRLSVAGDLVAVLQTAPALEEFGVRELYALSVHDLATGKRLWTRPVADGWGGQFSPDGSALILADSDGGLVADARTGAVRHRRSHR
jgi:hypothetical protein